jgi:hypothetical protein
MQWQECPLILTDTFCLSLTDAFFLWYDGSSLGDGTAMPETGRIMKDLF